MKIKVGALIGGDIEPGRVLGPYMTTLWVVEHFQPIPNGHGGIGGVLGKPGCCWTYPDSYLEHFIIDEASHIANILKHYEDTIDP